MKASEYILNQLPHIGFDRSSKGRLKEISVIPASPASVYTNNNTDPVHVGIIVLHNTNSTSETVKLYKVPNNGGVVGTASESNRFYSTSLSADETVLVHSDEVNIVLTATNDSIQAETTTADKVTIQMFGSINTSLVCLSEIAYVSDTAAAIYSKTVSGNTYVRSLILHNTNSTAEIVSIHAVPDNAGSAGTAADVNRMFNIELVADETSIIEFPYPGILLVDVGDTIQASTTTASKVTVQIYGGSALTAIENTALVHNTVPVVLTAFGAHSFNYPTAAYTDYNNTPSGVTYDLDNHYGDDAVIVSTNTNMPLKYPGMIKIPVNSTKLMFRTVVEPQTSVPWDGGTVVLKFQYKKTTNNVDWTSESIYTLATFTVPASGNKPQVMEIAIPIATLSLAVGDMVQGCLTIDNTSTYAGNVAITFAAIESSFE